MTATNNTLKLIQLGIDTYKEAVIFMRKDCHVCRSEGFEVHARIKVTLNDKSILATLYIIEDGLLRHNEASLSKYAWLLLDANEGDEIHLAHPKPLKSLSFVRSKVYGEKLDLSQLENIIDDVAKGSYSDIDIATFLTACAGGRLCDSEIIDLTTAMIESGDKISWPSDLVVDKHCVGGLPGNRTTLIVVPIVSSFGMLMPKTSSRAITSPSGTADTMEVLAPVNLNIQSMRKVVEQEGGCIIWGGTVDLSPADDILIRVEKVMDIDSEGQLIASVLSKKIAAGSSNIVIDIPVGPTAKVRSLTTANSISSLFHKVANHLGVNVNVIISDGSQPVGRGIGPALEAYDVLDVLQNKENGPDDLRDKALIIAGKIIEFSPKVKPGDGKKIAEEILSKGLAWQKFQAICEAQGGLREPTVAKYSHPVVSKHTGRITAIDNRQLARLAKLAGAPHDKASGIYLHNSLQMMVEKGEPLFTIYAESMGELRYAKSLLEQIPEVIQVEDYE